MVQVNGKLRDRITVPASITEDEAKEKALASPKVKAHTEGKKIIKTIYVPGRLVNIVVK
ncbi:Leucine--tRNA ligase [subsurface metagenome]